MAIQITAYVATSVDGFIASTDGSLDWLPGSPADAPEEDYGYHALLETINGLVMGRHTYETVLALGEWPYGTKPVWVLTHRAIAIPAAIATTVSAHSGTPEEIVQSLEKQGFQHIYVDGGKTIQAFLQAGLLHRLILTHVPILLGDGIPLFGPLPQAIRLYPSTLQRFTNGLVQIHYTVQGPS